MNFVYAHPVQKQKHISLGVIGKCRKMPIHDVCVSFSIAQIIEKFDNISRQNLHRRPGTNLSIHHFQKGQKIEI
jgi:hypothetical protein